MENNKAHIMYTAADLLRYHNGLMTDADMHKLERVALNDPMLQDALDGYALAKNPHENIAALTTQLQNKTVPAKVVGLNRNWLKAAAAILIIGGSIGYFVITNTNKKNTITVAQNTNVEAPVSVSTDSLAFTSAPNSAEDLVNTEAQTNTNGLVKSEAKLQGAAVPQNRPQARAGAAKRAEQPLPASRKYVLEGSVKDDEGAPVALAEVATVDKVLLGRTDSAGIFNLTTSDSTAIVVVSQNGYSSQPTNIGNMRKKEIVLSQTTVSNNDMASSAPNNNSRSNQIIINQVKKAKVLSATPIGGWNAFNSYLKKNTPAVNNAQGGEQHGNVELNFSIGNGGTPANVLVKSSNCTLCEMFAIKLLQNGPKWNGQSGIAYSVTIVF